jgi:putative heme iron utilization protein
MDAQARHSLTRLIRTQRIAALGTIWDTAPLVSMVLYVPAADLSAFYVHVSHLAQHTQALRQDRRVSLLIVEPDSGQTDPQLLARVSIRGEAMETPPTAGNYAEVKAAYLARFPQSAVNFGLEDFILYGIAPRNARYVAGFGRIFDLAAEDFRHIASMTT